MLLPLTLAAPGCASNTWEQRIATPQRAFYEGRPDDAVRLLDARLHADPDGPDAHVLRLERASALAAAGRYAESAAELVALDDQLEVLDYSSAPISELSALLFATDPQQYRASRPERVLLNTLNLLNFLALGDWEGAAVEARRARVLLLQGDLPVERRYGSPLTWALAGVALQLSGATSEAEDAFRSAAGAPDGRGAPRDQSRPVAVAAGDSAVAAGRAAVVPGNLAAAAGPGEASVLVIVQNGKAPVRVEATYRLLFSQGLHVLQIPGLVSRPSRFSRAVVLVDGSPVGEAPVLLDVASQARALYDREFPRLLAAAALAATPRVLAAGAVEHEIESHNTKGSKNRQWQEQLAQVAGFFTEELLADALPADTRCWTLLPQDIRALRVNVPAGAHTVAVDLLGPQPLRMEWSVDVEPGGFAVVNAITALDEGWQPPAEPRSQDLTHQPAGLAALNLLEAALAVHEVFEQHDDDHDHHDD